MSEGGREKDAPRAAAPSEPAGGSGGTTKLLVTMFLSAALAVGAAGCTSGKSVNADRCYDNNKDGYCDDDGSYVGGYYGTSGSNYMYYRGSRPPGGGTGSGIAGGSGGVSQADPQGGSSGSVKQPTTSESNGSFNSKPSTGSNGVTSGSKGGIGSSSGSSSS